jgi:hypothetical protein
LKRRGYNDKVIESGFSKASEINRNNLLEYKEKKINKRVPLVRNATTGGSGNNLASVSLFSISFQ